MSILTEKFLESMELISNAAISKTAKDLTVECLIEDVVDAKNGVYNVKYLDNILSVTASNPNLKYSIKDKVYILIPEGDLNKPKFIIGLVASQKGESHVDTDSQTDYIKITDNLFSPLEDGIKLCSYKTETVNLNNPLDPNLFPSNFANVLSNYLDNYNAFSLSMNIRTSLPVEQQKAMGDYGLQFMLPFIRTEEDGTQTSLDIYYSINTDNIFGNPYNLAEGVKQTIYFDIDEDLIYDVNRKPAIVCYIKDFIQSEEDKPYDVTLSNFALNIVQKIPEENKTGYYLYLTATEGPYFLNSASKKTKTITPHLLLNNEEISFDGADCYWFVEDVNVVPSSEDYTKLGGIGWKCLNKSDGGNYVTNVYTQEVNASDIMVTKRYKCLLQYNNTNIKGEISFKNFETKANVNLYIKNGLSFPKGSLVDLVCDVNFADATNQLLYDYAWARYNEKGNYIDNNFYQVVEQRGKYDAEGNRIGDLIEVLFDTNKMNDNLNTIYCSAFVIKNGTKQLIETKSATIKIEDRQFRLVIENDNIAYNYDADGDSPLMSAEYYDRPISSKLKAITPLSFRIYKDTGIELNELEYRQCEVQWYVPKQSMFELSDDIIKDAEINDDYYIVSGQGRLELDYLIAKKFNYDVLHSNILLKVKFGDLDFSQSATIRFVKDGTSGTNGTKFTASLLYNNYLYGEKDIKGIPHKLHLVYIDESQKWYVHNIENNTLIEVFSAGSRNIYFNNSSKDSNIALRVYKDGEEYNSPTDMAISWSIVDDKDKYTCFEIKEDEDKQEYLSPSIEKWEIYDDSTEKINYTNIIQAEVEITEKIGAQEYKTTLYVRYPIEITYVEKELPQFIPLVDGGYSEVTYATDGTNPQYNSNEPFTCEDILNGTNESYTYKWSFSRNFIKEKNKKKILTEKVKDPLTGQEIDKAVVDADGNIKFIEVIPPAYQCSILPLEKYNDDIRNNYIRVDITTDDVTTGIMFHVKPINCLFNQYGMSNINGWDGSKLEVDENGQYILAPQVGAGEKNSDNTFTGLVMGKSVNGEDIRYGLMGYYHGQQSIFLNAETGGATLGTAAAGQIIIEPNTEGEVDEKGNLVYRAVLKSGNYVPKDDEHEGSGMEIDLSTPSIRFGSEHFYVTEDGALNASGKGTIAGWSIEEDRLTSIKDKNKMTIQAGTEYDPMGNPIQACIYSNSHDKLENSSKGFYLGGNGISIGKSLRAECDYDEQNALQSVIYLGDVTNTESRWEINGYGTVTDEGDKVVGPYGYMRYGNITLNTGSNGVYLGTNGIRLGDKFRVKPNGVAEVGDLNGSRWIMSAGNDGAYISYSYDETQAADSFNGGSVPDGFSFDNYNANVFLGTKGISLGINKFFVTNNGEMFAVSGKIGGWSLSDYEISSFGLHMRGNTGEMYSLKDTDKTTDLTDNDYWWKIDGAGDALFNNIRAEGGHIGDWVISNGTLQSENGKLVLDADGGMQGDNWELAGWGGNIAGWQILNGYLACVDDEGHGISISSQSSSIMGDNWMIDNNSGHLGQFYFDADSNIGGQNWAISATGDGNFGSFTFAADGSIGGNSWSIDANGVATFDKVYALNLGDYIIDESGLHGGNFNLQGWIAEPSAFRSSTNSNIYIKTNGNFKIGGDSNYIQFDDTQAHLTTTSSLEMHVGTAASMSLMSSGNSYFTGSESATVTGKKITMSGGANGIVLSTTGDITFTAKGKTFTASQLFSRVFESAGSSLATRDWVLQQIANIKK